MSSRNPPRWILLAAGRLSLLGFSRRVIATLLPVDKSFQLPAYAIERHTDLKNMLTFREMLSSVGCPRCQHDVLILLTMVDVRCDSCWHRFALPSKAAEIEAPAPAPVVAPVEPAPVLSPSVRRRRERAVGGWQRTRRNSRGARPLQRPGRSLRQRSAIGAGPA